MLLSVGVAVANLLLNSTFNRGLYEPEGWSLNQSAKNRVEWFCDREDENQGGLKLTGCGEDWAGASSERVTVTPGEALTVVAWLQPEGALPDRDHLYVRFFSGGGFRGQTGPDIPTRGAMWTLCAGAVIVPEGCDTADVSLQIRSRGTVLLAAVGLFRGDLVARAGELLPKPPPLKPVPMKTPKGLPPDKNNNGLADRLEEFLAVPKGAASVRRKRRNTTCFQTPTGYRPDNDLKVGSVLVVNESREAIQSWQQMGYHSYYMTGFRAGPDYVDQHPGSVQQTRSGHLLDCGPGSYYMVPTEDRRKILRERFRLAFENGAEGAAPEEPEFIGSGGYSPAFQKEYQDFYGRPWVPPHTSPQARVDCQRLMGHLEVELLRACYDGAHSVKPKAPSFLLCHSPLNYASWGITFPHYETITKLKADSQIRIDQMIAQVWTGTARTPINHQGVRKERTFENAYLEYSSSLNLVRGKGIPTWLLMDPVEDNPDLPMEDYFHNYKRTLGAALMFPETDLYEVMPWPTRIFGRVPPQFATVVCTIVNALADMQNHRQVVHDRGTTGIASFLSDSAMWQRHEPSPSDFDALYGLTLPLLMKGIPVELAHLDRVGEKGYLNPYRVLLVSFDALKPIARANVDGLVAWVKAGGHLLVFGGDDPYNDLNLWWKDKGCRSPHEYLLTSLGQKPVARPDSLSDGEAVSETRVGKGSVLVCGLPPSHFTKSPAADQLLRSLVRRVCEQRAGLPYREQGRLGIQRGPYVVVKTFDEPAPVEAPRSLDSEAIDLMSPDLALRPAGKLGPDDLVVLRRLPRQKGEAPVVAASSMCVEWSATRGRELKLIASGPSGVTGVMRLVTGGKRISVAAQDAYGKEQPVRVEPEGDTALLRFDSQPQGLAMRIRTE